MNIIVFLASLFVQATRFPSGILGAWSFSEARILSGSIKKKVCTVTLTSVEQEAKALHSTMWSSWGVLPGEGSVWGIRKRWLSPSDGLASSHTSLSCLQLAMWPCQALVPCLFPCPATKKEETYKGEPYTPLVHCSIATVDTSMEVPPKTKTKPSSATQLYSISG